MPKFFWKYAQNFEFFLKSAQNVFKIFQTILKICPEIFENVSKHWKYAQKFLKFVISAKKFGKF
jgi:hypothetical protein